MISPNTPGRPSLTSSMLLKLQQHSQEIGAKCLGGCWPCNSLLNNVSPRVGESFMTPLAHLSPAPKQENVLKCCWNTHMFC